MTARRPLSPEEAAAWRAVIATVRPLHPPAPAAAAAVPTSAPGAGGPAERKGGSLAPAPSPIAPRPPASGPGQTASWQRHGLDGSWDRKLAQARLAPDLTIDLHGHNLQTAHARLFAGLAQARAGGARLVLVIAGKPRPHGDHDLRGSRRGAIRAKLLDWLEASESARHIAAIRPAHPRHGGEGALYVVLKARGRAP